MEFKIDSELKSLIPALTKDEYSRLESSIIKEGCRDKLIVWGDILVDGHNRYEICIKHNIKFDFTSKEFDTIEQAKTWMLINQLGRRNLTPEKFKYFIGKLYNESKKQGERTDITSPQNDEKLTTAEEIAKEYKIGKATVERAAKFAEAVDRVAEECGTEIKDDILNREIDLSQKDTLRLAQDSDKKEIVNILKSDKDKDYSDARYELYESSTIRKNDELKKVVIPLAATKYRTIVIDPPWETKKIIREVRPNQTESFDYPQMTLDEITAFPINDFCLNDCHLYLWVTHKYLPYAFDIVNHWGFNYQCLLTWSKNVGMTPFSWMYSTEHVLFCRKGNLDLLKKGERLDFSAKVREHSRKPNEFYDLVKKVSPELRIDIFGREKHEGFELYGNEPDKF